VESSTAFAAIGSVSAANGSRAKNIVLVAQASESIFLVDADSRFWKPTQHLKIC